jgi:hypothetical protein
LIVSHEHKFIFVKTRKTAGTSIEVFLARHLGPDAIVTPVVPAVDGHRAQHHDEWFNPLPQMLHQRRLKPALSDLKRHRTFWNHMPAARIKERVGAKVWRTYFKFCFERNPWDKVVSWYYFRQWKDPDMPFDDFVRTQDLPSDFRLYSLDGSVAVDFVGRFEQLTTDLARALEQVGIRAPVELTREKGTSRPPGARAQELFTPELDAIVSHTFAREIAEFGYEDRARAAPPA